MRWLFGTQPDVLWLGLKTLDAIRTASGPDNLMMATDPCCAPVKNAQGAARMPYRLHSVWNTAAMIANNMKA